MSDLDSSGSVEVDVGDEIVGVGLFPVAGSAICA